MKLKIFILMSIFSLSGCGGEIKYYDCEPSEKNCLSLPILVGNDKNSVGLAIITDGEYPVFDTERPTLALRYKSKPSQIEKLKHLEVKLFVDGKEVEPDSQEYTATYFSHVSNTVTVENEDCCEGLRERLGVNIAPKDLAYSDQLHSVKVVVTKDFKKSLGRLPERMRVVITATSDKETAEMERTVVLRSRKGSDFIRIH